MYLFISKKVHITSIKQFFNFSKRYLSIQQTAVQAYKNLFNSKYLFYTNTAIYIFLCCTGDCIQQQLEKYLHNKNAPYNFKRTGCMLLYAIFAAPINHFWYIGLDKLIVKGSIHAIVGKKLLADQLVFAPFIIGYFFLMMGYLENQTMKETQEEIKEKALTVYLADCCVWPPIQTINFYLIPSHMRLLYINVSTLCWNIFLSYSKHKERKLKESIPQ
ncbi:mpv17-like protein 2 isoform X1 [Hydra vulgaris]|uniref:mpv17-like protein 2 isoform X1 n=1 Tax=Hydra vulgaris TaxID=6087 RepID=UPI000640EC48|nr:mpv17-like protein 2 [Hydra vulgaris]